MVASKKKGNRFELEVSKILNQHFGEGFMRTPNSGATFGKGNRYRMQGIDDGFSHQMTGDLVVPKGFPFSIECKSYKDFEFHQVLQGENKTLDGWIAQAESDAKACNKEMILIMKFSRKGSYICSTDLIDSNKLPISNILNNYMWYKSQYLIYTLEDFLTISNEINIITDWKAFINKNTQEN
jgi:hypothetical protein